MKLRSFGLSFLLLLISFVSAAQTRPDKADVYFGYSRVGANLYSVYTPGMNGWQLAVHIKPFRFVGVEGDVSHYSQSLSGFTQQVTLGMFGPRVTVGVKGFTVFAHGLGGIAHENATVTIYPAVGYDATSYALGGGADVPLSHGFKLRMTGDYLGNSKAPDTSYSPSHFRAGVGISYHF
jgi:hypothetical protein